MKVLGITGGIASGKSLVTKQFQDKGFPVYDSDQIVHSLYQDRAVIDLITARFPSVNEQGVINRKKLGDLIFNDPIAKRDLENIFHPKVYETLKAHIANHGNDAWVVLDIPLLYETGGEALCDMVLVVYVDPVTQLNRLMARNHLSESEAKSRIEAQMPLHEKMQRADIVINNSGTIPKTLERVNEIIDKVLI
ncbi:dephospho-CoA kinase [Acholeplasma vituli]|uniref:Dephospho-CoA kinase n=1 Tax=Paracholeplasma vituli TaxID=69473 RepID=A0ABT2PUY8_9MOLU|nr:dephospho-CoA kinase [Paracholeplasma vituli]MCU0104766.1 dephospho-CoA kinase [Paracholeplasma vituli]